MTDDPDSDPDSDSDSNSGGADPDPGNAGDDPAAASGDGATGDDSEEPIAWESVPAADGPEVLLRLPADARESLKEPLGPVYADPEVFLAAADDPILAVGDAVTYHLREAGRPPDLAVVDGLTQRQSVDGPIGDVVDADDPDVTNPAATLTAELLAAVREGVAAADGRTLVVEGEEDLATLPAVLTAPDGATVVYGQPDEGMVLVAVDDGQRDRARELLDLFEGDHERALSLLELD